MKINLTFSGSVNLRLQDLSNKELEHQIERMQRENLKLKLEAELLKSVCI